MYKSTDKLHECESKKIWKFCGCHVSMAPTTLPRRRKGPYDALPPADDENTNLTHEGWITNPGYERHGSKVFLLRLEFLNILTCYAQ